jgi:hypothetical protein
MPDDTIHVNRADVGGGQVTTEAATTFRVGDRVRRKESAPPSFTVSRGIVGVVFEAVTGPEAYHVAWGNRSASWVDVENLELIERRWYAPPGVPMLALTPEVLEALEDAHGSLLVAHAESCYYKKECDCEKNYRILELAIAAAQKEASP